MIRRGFWLVAGAAIGVTGYRKATRLGRTLIGQQGMAQLSRTPPRRPIATMLAGADRGATSPWPVRLAAGTRSAAGFIRDVREGMADYRASNDGQDTADNAARPAGQDTLDYHALRDEQLGSLGSQRDRGGPV